MFSVIDTGSSAINFSTLYYEDFINKIFEKVGGTEYQFEQGLIVTQCYNNFPKLHFMFSERFIQVDPEDYVIDVSEGQDRSVCLLLLVASDMPIHVLGMPLFINYYSVHNLEEASIEWAPIPGSPKPALKSGVLPVQFFAAAGQAARGTSPYTYIIEGLLIAGAVILFIYVVWPWIQTLT